MPVRESALLYYFSGDHEGAGGKAAGGFLNGDGAEGGGSANLRGARLPECGGGQYRGSILRPAGNAFPGFPGQLSAAA